MQTLEDVLNVIDIERPEGVIVQFGGQTPLKLAMELQRELDAAPVPAASGAGNVKIWGTPPDAIDRAEDRDRWMDLLTRLGIRQPAGKQARRAPLMLRRAPPQRHPLWRRSVLRAPLRSVRRLAGRSESAARSPNDPAGSTRHLQWARVSDRLPEPTRSSLQRTASVQPLRRTSEEAMASARQLGYPCMVRPSYVLGGRAMEIVYSDAALEHYLATAVKVRGRAQHTPRSVHCLLSSRSSTSSRPWSRHARRARHTARSAPQPLLCCAWHFLPTVRGRLAAAIQARVLACDWATALSSH